MSSTDTDRRILFVHAHPDDESIGTGATIAKYAAEGADVRLVTCTLGEEGEVIPDELRYLASDKEDRLGEFRVGELAAACTALGLKDHRFLGGTGRWRDSGMMGAATNDDPRCFWRADLDEACRELVAVVREQRPHVMVTYDDRGYYGHPDHIQAHRVAWAAFEKAADASFGEGPPWQVAKFYATAMPRTVLARSVAVARDVDVPFETACSVDELPFGVPDEQVTTVVDARDHLRAKFAALRAHRTQVIVEEPFFALSDNVGQQAFGAEYYTLLAGPRGFAAANGRETDLFAGLH
ncbi:N-acetyl-1-D-myo-inositol-2-amino-2-deoxy-alpha-D-glucopyranoside deacetylase [Actinomadura alba]|uniref:1D-myo-inositol 2-acetamido-2-deoxy-alpha-D-glucopyranoside deacetylase n=1 Tax=Actinomadura alba TaxID=406431 RepID=A0ABR7LRB1_9ACTN|nr:N-acetyl-1-D-myo-inositol-2-amino-2-deoxy-alpha-D-glucopyranoside deacetylase [Actinomadura alba]MBC6467037.1 N-acetyl-1-D-myo-inositol-2-amino-2-deoxy-alpha-D-glucopyranoside deacetylase [Actinomadura alba]